MSRRGARTISRRPKACGRSPDHFTGPLRFVLAGSGHIAGRRQPAGGGQIPVLDQRREAGRRWPSSSRARPRPRAAGGPTGSAGCAIGTTTMVAGERRAGAGRGRAARARRCPRGVRAGAVIVMAEGRFTIMLQLQQKRLNCGSDDYMCIAAIASHGDPHMATHRAPNRSRTRPQGAAKPAVAALARCRAGRRATSRPRPSPHEAAPSRSTRQRHRARPPPSPMPVVDGAGRRARSRRHRRGRPNAVDPARTRFRRNRRRKPS